ncbi:MAG TPA: hypothetical protein VG937_30200 [Polyangiaceae bacterium]|nr:hypothetical protein [Polyangiaceae bacterium]
MNTIASLTVRATQALKNNTSPDFLELAFCLQSIGEWKPEPDFDFGSIPPALSEEELDKEADTEREWHENEADRLRALSRGASLAELVKAGLVAAQANDNNAEPAPPGDLEAPEESPVAARRSLKELAAASGKPAYCWDPLDPKKTIIRVVAALETAPLYQRGGTLVEIVRDASSGERVQPDSNPRLREVTSDHLGICIGSQVTIAKSVVDAKTGERGYRPIPVPTKLATGIHGLGQWQHIRPIKGLADYPVLRPDGSILKTQGYDPKTCYYLTGSLPLEVPEEPTREQAIEALQLLHDLISDFQFTHPAHRSAFIAGLLTILARPAIQGPVPMLVVEAAKPGSGKTLLADLLGVLSAGEQLPRTAIPTGRESNEEWRKKLLVIGRSGAPVKLLDNITVELRSAALDAALTGGYIEDRVLGSSAEIKVPFQTFLVATLNNATVSTDLVRRTIVARITPESESPETRTDFKFPGDRLLCHAREYRLKYLTAAFTILRAYWCAGCPEPSGGVGSFEAWSRVVRGPLIWLGEPDPIETQAMLRQSADNDSGLLVELLHAWHGAFTDTPTAAAAVLDRVENDLTGKLSDLRDSLVELAGRNDRLPSAKSLGRALGKYRDNHAGGYVLREKGADSHSKTKLWAVEKKKP